MNRIYLGKTITNDQTLQVSSLGIENIIIQSPFTFPTYTLTLPPNTGTAGQVLTTNGYGTLSWSSGPGVQTISVTSPITSTGGQNPTIGLSTVPTTLGGTGLTTIGTNGQVLQSNGTSLQYVTLPTPVTSVSASSPLSSSGGTTPTISLSTVPTTLGGTGLTTIGTNGQVLQSNGTSLQYVTLPTPVTSVSASSPLNSSGGTTPTISLSTVPTTLGGTGLTTVGTNNQVLTSNGSSLFWSTPTTGTVTSVTASSPLSSSGGNTPNLTLSTVPTTLGGTGLTGVGTNGQVLTSNGTSLSWQTPLPPGTGTVTSVSASVPTWLSVTVTNPTTTPAIAISGTATGTGTVSVLQESPTINTLLTVSGEINVSRNSSSGLGISVYNTDNTYPTSSYIAVGRNSSGLNHTHFGTIINGNNDATNYGYIQFNSNQIKISGTGNVTIPSLTLTTALSTANGGTGLTTVGTANQVLTSNGTSLYWTTPTTGTVTSVSATSPLASSGGATPTISIASSTGTGAVVLASTPTILSQLNVKDVSNNGILAAISQTGNNYIQSGLTGATGSTADLLFTTIGATYTNMIIKSSGLVGIGTVLPGAKLHIEGAPGSFGVEYLASNSTLLTTINSYDIIQRWYESTGNASYIDLTWIRTSTGGAWDSAGQRFQAKTDATFQGYIEFNGPTMGGIRFGAGGGTTPDGVPERMRILTSGKVLVNTTVDVGGSATTFEVQGRIRSKDYSSIGDVGCLELATGTNTSYLFQNGGAGVQLDLYGNSTFIVNCLATPALPSAYNELLRLYAPNNTFRTYIGMGKSASLYNGGFFAYDSYSTSGYFVWNHWGTNDNMSFNTAGDLTLPATGGLQFGSRVRIKATSSSFYDFILPSGPGTSGQVLTSAGAGNAMYWGTGGGGGGGSVNSVTASSPLASSGGTAPNISIASSTGSGAVVLQTDPQLLGSTLMASGFGPLLRFTHDVAGGINYIQSGAAFSAGSAQDLNFGPILTADSFMRIKANGYIGIGTTSPASLLHTKVAGTGVTNTLTIEAGTGNSTANVAKLALNTRGGGGGAINQGIESIFDSGLSFYGLKITTDTLLNVYSSASSINAMRLVADSSNTFLYLQAAAGSNQTGISFMDSSNVPKSGFTQTSAGFSMVSSLPNMGISCPAINFSSFPATNNCVINLKANAVTFTITTFTYGATEFNSTQNDTIFTRQTIFKGGELLVYKQTYSDPDSGTAYTAKFGSSSGNGIAVRGNSRFIDTVAALGGFTTNLTDVFTYEEITFSPIIAFHTYNYNGDGLIVTDVNGYFNFWAYTTQQGKIVRIGKNVTITWNIEFSYANNVANLNMVIPIGYAQFRSALAGPGSVGFPTSLNNLTNASNYGVCGIYVQNISYNGNPRTGICVTGRESSYWYTYYSGGSMPNQRFTGSVSYNIL